MWGRGERAAEGGTQGWGAPGALCGASCCCWGQGGSDGACPPQRAWAGQRGPFSEVRLGSQGMQAEGRETEAWGGTGFKRAGGSCRGRATAPSAGGGHRQKFQRPGGRWDCLEPLPDQLLSQPRAAPSPRSHPPRRGAQASCRPPLTHAAPCHVPVGPHMPSRHARVRKAGRKAMFSLPDGACAFVLPKV